MGEKTIYDLQLHESITVILAGHCEFEIIRVASGWLYLYHRLDGNSMTTTFVPFDNNFQERKSPI